MTRKELYENKLQMDYFSDAYIRFEEDFQKYSAMNVPYFRVVTEKECPRNRTYAYAGLKNSSQ